MRIEQLTFTRFLAALIIVVFHFGLEVPPFTHPSVSFLFSNVGISYFFVLSGFVMVVAYSKSGKPIKPGIYFKNRFARVYPVYLLAFLLTLLIMWICYIPIKTEAIPFNIFMVQSWLPPYTLVINRPGWTLSVEVLFYLSFPCLYNHVYTKYKLVPIAIAILAFWLISQMIGSYLLASAWYKADELHHNLLYYFPPLHFNQFLMGNLFGLVLLKVYGHFTRNLDLVVVALLAFTAALLKYPVPYANYHDGFLAILFAVIILCISLNNGFFTKISNHKSLIFLGEISFGIYILQIPVYNIVYKITKPFYYQHTQVFFYVYLVVLILFAAFSFQYIETPLRRWIRRHY
ncbi:acyltransferase family protein [Parasediminibacterium sp. JCM 36343]|uniref:acyltransferase family protein n=1 Tax=Parasediminibacterium sp. JCM 36343 TaxID=3374279 RepID=UPI00397C97E8